MQNTITSAAMEDVSATSARAEQPIKFDYIPSLDGLRAVAVVFVVLFHSLLLVPDLKQFFGGGFLGVDIFFVLSGFLITSILLQEFDRTEDINFKKFYMRRFLRLMPAYWVQLAVLFFFAYLVFPITELDKLSRNNTYYYALFYVTNWQRVFYGSGISGLLGHTWSLAIEEQFYLFWAGFLFLMLRRLNRRSVILTTAGIILSAALFRAFRWQGPESVDLLYNAFDSRIDALLTGCLVSQLLSWRMLPKTFLASKWLDVCAAVALWVVTAILLNVSESYSTPFLYQGGLTVFAVAVGTIIIWLTARSNHFISKFLELPAVVWVGKTSYGLYLWHAIAISYTYYNFQGWPLLSKFTIAMVIAFMLTAASYYLVELPFLRLKERFRSTPETVVVN